MKVHEHVVAGDRVQINVVETEEDLQGFRDFIRGHLRFLGLDSETTGLDTYNDGFRCRVVQFGTPTEAWVVPVEKGPRFAEDVRLALKGVDRFVLHNASYDLQVFEKTLGVPMEDMWPKVTDTKILAHLVNPVPVKEGGPGLKLEELTKVYIDPSVAENVKGLIPSLMKKYRASKATVWKKVVFEDEDYQLYSGMDPILAARLYQKLERLVPAVSKDLVPYEHKLAEVCSYMERTGFLLDVEYSKKLSMDMKFRESTSKETALNFGCENVNSTEQVADVLEARGVRIIGRTPSGKRQVNDDLLSRLADQGDEFAHAVIEGKKWGKWRTTWVDTFLKERDSKDLCHANINPLQARTARMSITGIPAQTLPSKDWMIRRCFLADEGHRIASVDYQAQELRVLAALSGDQTMIQAFLDGADLHLLTAQAAWPGTEITKELRGYAKTVNFGRVYGGGAKTVAEQTGLDLKTAKMVVDGFDKAYPGVKQFSAKLQREAAESGYVITPTGRRLPVDSGREYSALNYVIQSTSRDVTGKALIRLHEAGFTPYLRLAIHDEILASVPEPKAEWGSREIGRIMAEQMGPVFVCTEPEVGARSWGSLYGADY